MTIRHELLKCRSIGNLLLTKIKISEFSDTELAWMVDEDWLSHTLHAALSTEIIRRLEEME